MRSRGSRRAGVALTIVATGRNSGPCVVSLVIHLSSGGCVRGSLASPPARTVTAAPALAAASSLPGAALPRALAAPSAALLLLALPNGGSFSTSLELNPFRPPPPPPSKGAPRPPGCVTLVGLPRPRDRASPSRHVLCVISTAGRPGLLPPVVVSPPQTIIIGDTRNPRPPPTSAVTTARTPIVCLIFLSL